MSPVSYCEQMINSQDQRSVVMLLPQQLPDRPQEVFLPGSIWQMIGYCHLTLMSSGFITKTISLPTSIVRLSSPVATSYKFPIQMSGRELSRLTILSTASVHIALIHGKPFSAPVPQRVHGLVSLDESHINAGSELDVLKLLQ